MKSDIMRPVCIVKANVDKVYYFIIIILIHELQIITEFIMGVYVMLVWGIGACWGACEFRHEDMGTVGVLGCASECV